MARFSFGASRAHLTALAAVAFATIAILAGAQSPAHHSAQAAVADFCEDTVQAPIVIKPTMPPKFVFFPGEDFRLGQDLADCDAWQQFVYMNWPAQASPSHGVPDPSRPFGTSNIERAVWVSYDRPTDIFVVKPNAAARSAKITLRATGEFLGNTVDFGATGQAGSNGWIVGHGTVKSTDGRLTFAPLTFYDVWVNNDEEQYIWGNHLQYALGQAACVRAKAGLQLPKGTTDVDCAGKPATYGLGIGAVELKAALLDLGPFPMQDGRPDLAAASHRAPTFFLFPVPVDLVYPAADTVGTVPIGKQANRLVGLVGLHIIRKIPGAQRFLWSTFEHIDNDPTAGSSPQPRAWTYFNPSSTASPNVNPSQKPCPTGGCNYGMSQLTRTVPINETATSATASFWSKIASSSVFRHYELVDVQWTSRDYALVPGAGPTADANSFVPDAFSGRIANTTLESYKQSTTCVACHFAAQVAKPSTTALLMGASHGGGKIFVIPLPKRNAKLTLGATPQPQSTGPPYVSDFSFLFRDFAIQGPLPPAR